MRRSLAILQRWHMPALGFALLTLLARAPSVLSVVLVTIAAICCAGMVFAARDAAWLAILIILAIAYPFDERVRDCASTTTDRRYRSRHLARTVRGCGNTGS